MKTAIAACMRNEGPWLLEWLAYHHVIGFDALIVATNDCTDGSDLLLDLLAEAGVVTHLRNKVPADTAPQHSGMTLVFDHLSASDVTFLLHADSDEFLNIGLGEGRVSDLLERAGEADVIALPWRAFGDSGHVARTLPVLPAFTACEAEIEVERVKFKCMFRHRNFTHANDHVPTGSRLDDPLVLAPSGKPLGNAPLFKPKRVKFRPYPRAIGRGEAVLNHYAIRAADDFLMKNDRGDGQGKLTGKYRIGSAWHRAANRNEGEDRSILRHWPETAARMAEWRALPGVAEAEAACLAWDSARRAQVLTPENRRRWTLSAQEAPA
ncbi:hypothetical protein E0K89_004435 [Aquicoccus sp. SCR17]|nr:hypothetical protein [Carideicomes alvinocaridis]